MASNLEKAKQALQGNNQTYIPPQYQSIYRIRMDEISQMIKTERKNLKWSQRKLALKSGYSQGTITRIEKHGWCSISAIIHVLEAMGKKISLTNI